VTRALLIFVVVCVLSGCGGTSSKGSRTRTVVAGFYPLAWAVERVGGGRLNVVNLTPAGAEPHDLELTPRDVERVHDASYVVYVGGGFQPALEDAVSSRAGPALDVLATPGDPHVWLDPPAFAEVVRKIGAALHRRSRGQATARDVLSLDREYRRGLAECRRRAIVTTHAAFGRLAARYGLAALALAGRSPESEPSPKELERIVAEVRASGATTVFTEPLVSSRLAETVAREAGADVATLDPIEGLTEERLAAGDDYLSVMRSNLQTLRKALGCR
jgi:zinc transport system substrate-binding protein